MNYVRQTVLKSIKTGFWDNMCWDICCSPFTPELQCICSSRPKLLLELASSRVGMVWFSDGLGRSLGTGLQWNQIVVGLWMLMGMLHICPLWIRVISLVSKKWKEILMAGHIPSNFENLEGLLIQGPKRLLGVSAGNEWPPCYYTIILWNEDDFVSQHSK